MPRGTLYVVATPLGNLADLSPRAAQTLASVDLIACEDTRVSRTLLARHGIDRPLVALHEHNERRSARELIAGLREGKTVALISDAGTPAVSDPGAHLVEEAHRAGIAVSPIPGPSAIAAAYSASGFEGGFLFAGFLPAGGVERRRAIEALAGSLPVILFEAPHRIARTLSDLLARFGAERPIVIGRELTKKFEEVTRLSLGDAPAWLEAEPRRRQGEFVLVLGPGEAASRAAAADIDAILDALLEALPPSEAARIAARVTGLPKKDLYRRALARRTPGDPASGQ